MNKQTPQQRQYERRKGQPKITGLYISHEEKALLDTAVAISGGIKAAIFDGLRLVVADQEKIATWISEDALKIIEAVAHIGVDFGFGRYELEQVHIDSARSILESLNHRDNQEVYRDLMEAAKDIRRKAGVL